jgi:hypothetical protein
LHAVEFEAEQRMEALRSLLRTSIEWHAKERDAWDAADAVRPAGELLPVDQGDADHLAESKRDDGKIVAAQAQHGEAENDAEERCEQARQRQARPEAEIQVDRQLGV